MLCDRGQARGLRSLWSCGAGRDRDSAAVRLRAAWIWATSSATCSARCSRWAARKAQRAARGQQRGDDLRFDMTIDFEDAFFGTETEVKIRRLETCTRMQRARKRVRRGPSVCSQCQGRGQLRYQQGFFSVARTCGACSGTGTVISDPCTTCRGEGRERQEIKLNVKVPPGVEDGTRIRYWRRRRRGASAAVPRAICTCAFRPAARLFRAARLRSALRDSDQLSAGGAGRGVRDSRNRWAGEHQDSRRHAERQGVARSADAAFPT